MIAPRFTLRFGLLALTVASVGGIALREASLGAPWATAFCLAASAVVFLLLLHAVVFAATLALSRRSEDAE